MMTTQTLYETDFYAWSQQQAQLLEQRDFAHLDFTNLIEEIEDMGKNRQRELSSRLQVLLAHLLKWQYQPAKRSPSWQATIRIQRAELADLLADNPSLRPQLATFISRAYPKARQAAWGETGLEEATFPTLCPYTQKQIFDDTFLPEA
jgi:Domain of unknown function DUF29